MVSRGVARRGRPVLSAAGRRGLVAAPSDAEDRRGRGDSPKCDRACVRHREGWNLLSSAGRSGWKILDPLLRLQGGVVAVGGSGSAACARATGTLARWSVPAVLAA